MKLAEVWMAELQQELPISRSISGKVQIRSML